MGAKEAGQHLAHLLLQPGFYRQRWKRVAKRGSSDASNYAAIATVIQDHLWDAGERPDTDTTVSRSIKDRVRRAMLGEFLTTETLTWFIGAFVIPDNEARRLHALLDGSSTIRVLSGDAERGRYYNRQARSVSLHEHHYVGADRLPAAHETTQVLEATADDVTSYTYVFDTAALTVEVVHGGATDGGIFEIEPGIFGVDIALTRTLMQGETATLKYRTTFFYEQAPPAEFRRAAFTPTDSVDLRVQFHPDALPRAAFFAEWTSLDQRPVRRQPTALEPDGSVHMFLRSVQDVVVGFEWEW